MSPWRNYYSILDFQGFIVFSKPPVGTSPSKLFLGLLEPRLAVKNKTNFGSLSPGGELMH